MIRRAVVSTAGRAPSRRPRRRDAAVPAGEDAGATGSIILEMKLKIVLESSDEGGFTAYVPSLPGCISEGDSRDDALSNIREAIELYLER